jgi:hypothetical protein
MAVFFVNDTHVPFGGTTLSVPAGVHTTLVTGLIPNAAYAVASQSGTAGTTIVISSGGAGATADAAGVLRLTF